MPSTPIADIRLITDGLEFPEGPVALDNGDVLVCEIKGQRITRVKPDGTKQHVADVPGGPNGAALGPDGVLYLANNGGCFTWHDVMGFTFPGPPPDTWTGGSIDRLDLATGALTTLYRASGDTRLRAPNDLVMDGHGGVWFTDHGVRLERSSDRTGVHYARLDGSESREVEFPVDAPNGIGLSPDGTKLYWAETHTGRVFQRTIASPGELAPTMGPLDPTGLLCGLPGMQLFDSLAVDGAGHVCVATLVNGGITVIDPVSGDSEHVNFGAEYADPLTTNICFGGPDLRTAYITLSGTGRLISCIWPRPGLRLHHAR